MTYCGTDIIEVKRIEQAIKSDSFLNKMFSKDEIAMGKIKSEATRYQYYAGRFAAKEAFFKAFSNIFKSNLNSVEILNDKNGRPYINALDSSLKEYITSNNIAIDISISHIQDTAIACCVISL